MTQYCVLGAWEASHYGFTISQPMMENVAIWLLKIQDPNGGFPYQGKPSDSYELISQESIRHSTTSASLG